MPLPFPGMESKEKIPPDSSVRSFMVESLSPVRDEPLRETAARLNPLIQSLHSRNLLKWHILLCVHRLSPPTTFPLFTGRHRDL
jgi:hypothetical protein